jgi:hypothetical protein
MNIERVQSLLTATRTSSHKLKSPEIDRSIPSSRRFYYRAGTATRSKARTQAKRDMPLSSFLLGLVFIGVALAAYADRPPHVVPFQTSIDAKLAASPTRNLLTRRN